MTDRDNQHLLPVEPPPIYPASAAPEGRPGTPTAPRSESAAHGAPGLAARPYSEVATIEGTQPSGLMAAIFALSRDPAVNIATVEALVGLHERMEDRQAEIKFNEAMNAAQAEIQPVARTAENTQTRSFYAKLETVDAAIRPIYLRHGFSLSYNTIAPLTPGNIRVECRCAHIAGHAERYAREAPADTLGPKGTAVKTVLHGGGSTETYLKRYLACGIFNVVFRNLDDDGNRGGGLMEEISDEECAELSRGVTETGLNLNAFLSLFGVQAIPDIQKKDLATARNAINLKRRGRQA